MTSVFVVGADHQIKQMYREKGFSLTDRLPEADIVQFIGGYDIDPALYGEPRLSRTSISKSCDERDVTAYKQCKPNQMKIGICRGGQLLNVLNGGWMWQHVSGHAAYAGHEMQDVLFGKKLRVTSTHHQMMIPCLQAGAEVLAFAEGLATHMETGHPDGRKHDGFDTEVVWYDRTNSLCFQPHPEYGQFPDCRKYFFDLIEMLKP